MTSAENTPTEPIPAPEPAPDATAPMYATPAEQPVSEPGATPAEQPVHAHGHHLTNEGVALVVVGALLFGALAFALGWFGGSMHTRFAVRRAIVMGRTYGFSQGPQGFGQGNGQGNGQGYGYGRGYGHGFGMGRGYGRRFMTPQGAPQGTQPNSGGPGATPWGSNPATPPAQ